MIDFSQVARHINEHVESKLEQDLPEALQKVRLFGRGSVTAVAENFLTVQVQRTDQSSSDGKWYPTLGSYTPEVGDNVFLCRVGTGWLVLGELRSQKQPSDGDIIAPRRLLQDCQYVDAEKTTLTGSYVIGTQPDGLWGTLLDQDPTVAINLQLLGGGTENLRARQYVTRLLTDGSGQAIFTLPPIVFDQSMVWVTVTPYGNDAAIIPSYTTTVTGSDVQVTVKLRDTAGDAAAGRVAVACAHYAAVQLLV